MPFNARGRTTECIGNVNVSSRHRLRISQHCVKMIHDEICVAGRTRSAPSQTRTGRGGAWRSSPLLGPDWRALYGSHLSADERLFAVMVWRRCQHERLLARLRARHRELVAERERAVDTVDRGLDSSMAERVLRSLPHYSKLLAPSTLAFMFPDYSRPLASFMDPLYSHAAKVLKSLYAPPPLSCCTGPVGRTASSGASPSAQRMDLASRRGRRPSRG